MFRNIDELWKLRCLLCLLSWVAKLSNASFPSFYMLFFSCPGHSVYFLVFIVDLGHSFYSWQFEEEKSCMSCFFPDSFLCFSFFGSG